MLRGVNKNIVVVKGTGSDFFEEAIFIVKPQTATSPVALLDEARRIVESAMPVPKKDPVDKKQLGFRRACYIIGIYLPVKPCLSL